MQSNVLKNNSFLFKLTHKAQKDLKVASVSFSAVHFFKAQDDLKEAKKIYEDLNNELHVELPDFYNRYCQIFLSNVIYVFYSGFGQV